VVVVGVVLPPLPEPPLPVLPLLPLPEEGGVELVVLVEPELVDDPLDAAVLELVAVLEIVEVGGAVEVELLDVVDVLGGVAVVAAEVAAVLPTEEASPPQAARASVQAASAARTGTWKCMFRVRMAQY
jgi:hypothetical protein